MNTSSGPGHDSSEQVLGVITGERRRLINVAYRLLGSLTEAEDAVQEAYARWYAMPRRQQEAVESPGAWLTTVASRICLDLPAPPGSGASATSANGYPSRCPAVGSGSADREAARGRCRTTPPTSSPWTSR